MANSQSILERVFVQTESTYGVAPNSTGTATVAGGDYIRTTKCQLLARQDVIKSSDKTGTISETAGAIGARGGSWSLDMEARPSGAAGTAPDCDPVLQAVFGQAPTVVSSTSVTYNFSSAIKSFSMYRFRQPSSIMQQLGLGCVVGNFSFEFAQNANCHLKLDGTCLWVDDSKNHAGLDSVGQGGLTAIPSEPGSPTFAGTPVNSLTGTATIDGNTTIQISSTAVRLQPGIVIPNDRLFGGQYGSAPERDTLKVFLDLGTFDQDIAAQTALYTKALAGTPIDITILVGSVAGSKIQLTLNDCQLPMPELTDDARKWAAKLTNIQAFATTSSSLDEFSLAFL